ncbi:uncharacterized protein [Penaeus vannamei]|uniref:uncharacterized protein isoform X3 n=1 Tax=Penaeus vannamei TaxID=6689 RepID=UPI00387FA121
MIVNYRHRHLIYRFTPCDVSAPVHPKTGSLLPKPCDFFVRTCGVPGPCTHPQYIQGKEAMQNSLSIPPKSETNVPGAPLGPVLPGLCLVVGMDAHLPQEIVMHVGDPLPELYHGRAPRSPVRRRNGTPKTRLQTKAVASQQQNVAIQQKSGKLQCCNRYFAVGPNSFA